MWVKTCYKCLWTKEDFCQWITRPIMEMYNNHSRLSFACSFAFILLFLGTPEFTITKIYIFNDSMTWFHVVCIAAEPQVNLTITTCSRDWEISNSNILNYNSCSSFPEDYLSFLLPGLHNGGDPERAVNSTRLLFVSSLISSKICFLMWLKCVINLTNRIL